MATLPLVESGRVGLTQIRQAVLPEIRVPQVDPIGARQSAQDAGTLSQILDRMSQSAFGQAAKLQEQAGLEFAAQNPITADQIEAAKGGNIGPLQLGSNMNIFDAAVRKARSLELSTHFESEGKGELIKMLAQMEDPLSKVTAQDVSQKIATMTDGLGKSLAAIDPEAAYKFRATMATHGNTVLKAAYETDLKRLKAMRVAKFDATFDAGVRLLEKAASTDPDNFEAQAQVFRENVLMQSTLIGDAAIQTQYSTRLEPAIRNAKIGAINKVLMQEQYLENPRSAEKLLMSGTIPGAESLLKNLKDTDTKAIIEIRDEFIKAARARKEGIELSMADSVREGDDLLRRIYSSSNPKEQANLFKQLSSLPVDPSKIRSARDFMASELATGPQNDDLGAFSRISQRVSLGLASEAEIISAPLTQATKKQLLARRANPDDDISYGVKQISLAVGIQSGNLPPELKSAEARQLAVETKNTLERDLYLFARTPNEKGVLPTPAEIRQKGNDLSQTAAKGMSKAFSKAAESSKNTAYLMLPELNGVDLNNEAAVSAAFAKATSRKASDTTIKAARSAVDDFRANSTKAQEGQR